jgi:aldose 1-epimerase
MTDVLRAARTRLGVAVVAAMLIAAVTGGSAALAGSRSHARSTSHHQVRAVRSASRMASHSRAKAGTIGISSVSWGVADSQPVRLFTLHNSRGMKVKITNYGGVVQSILVPNRKGKLTDVALGFPSLADYVADFTQGATSTPWPLSGGTGDAYFGAIIGRYANRIANASFALNGTTYKLDANNGTNMLHGGYLGWNTKVWSASTSKSATGVSLKLTNTFPAGEGCLPSLSPGCTGFPAAVKATVVYTLTRDNQLQISYAATNESSSLSTVINLTNHTYFNLGGQASGTVYNQLLALNSNKYTPVNVNLIPEAPFFVNVGGTPYNFRSMHTIGKYIRATNLPDGTPGPIRQLQIAHGYDNNWVLNGAGSYRLVAVAQDPGNGITLWTYTDQPGVQVYTGNFLVGDLTGTTGTAYRQGDAFTLETQHYPDSPHHIGQAGWPTVVLPAGHTFSTKTSYAFGVKGRNFKNGVHFG